MDAAIEAAIIGGFIGAVVGGGISCYLSRQTIKASFGLVHLQERNRAAAQFRNVFLGATLYLRDNIRIKGTGTSNKINEFLGTLIFMHMEALTSFESFLNASERKRIRLAWDEYCHPKGISQDPNEKRDFRFNDYMIIEESEGANKAKEVALQKIYKILEIADFR